MRAVDLVVVGGSAGAIEALEVLLPVVTPGHPPVVVVVHIGAQRSGLADLFDGRCAVPVREANDQDVLADGTIVFAPSGYHLLVGREGALSLSCDAKVHHARPSIDVLFESAAWAYGARVLGIVLSGASDDGASGAAAIERAGGEVWVQDAAVFSVMPDAAAKACARATRRSIADLARDLASISTSRTAS